MQYDTINVKLMTYVLLLRHSNCERLNSLINTLALAASQKLFAELKRWAYSSLFIYSMVRLWRDKLIIAEPYTYIVNRTELTLTDTNAFNIVSSVLHITTICTISLTTYCYTTHFRFASPLFFFFFLMYALPCEFSIRSFQMLFTTQIIIICWPLA